MEAEIKTSIHNRFDIEVRDIATNELKQSGVAENIVLDRAYTRICNFTTYFTRIHFGSGTGTLDPSRTTLFTPISQKIAVDEEKIKEYPVSKITKKIILAPEEFVGQTITEVGISETTNAINTHALIKDAEGNPLSITKTDTDVVTIYATVFIELQDASEITFSKFDTNELINYFIDGTGMNPTLWIGHIGEQTEMGTIGYKHSNSSLTATPDVTNKKVKYSTRLGTGSGNIDIREMSLSDICRIGLGNSQAWNPYALIDVAIGVGDGETETFDLGKYDTSNVVIKIDGNIANDYVLENTTGDNREYLPLYKLISPNAVDIDKMFYQGACVGVREEIDQNEETEWVIEVDDTDIVDEKIEIKAQYTSTVGAGSYVYVYGSYNGEDFTQIYHDQHSGTKTHTIKIASPYKYIKVRTAAGNRTVYIYHVLWVNKRHKRPQVVFDNPPPADSIITADYTVPYIPKTTDFVLDVDFTLQFGEGV